MTTPATKKAAGRRRMRIRAVADEWARNLWLALLPGGALLLAALSEGALSADLYVFASCLTLLSQATVGVFLSLLAVAFVRL